MKINNALHHISIRRGIEVLRTHNFNLGTLKRRPSLERSSDFMSSTLNGSAMKADSKERDVSLWTNHRVMEWLRMIDLSEYAANLRGSGVHGALIVSISNYLPGKCQIIYVINVFLSAYRNGDVAMLC